MEKLKYLFLIMVTTFMSVVSVNAETSFYTYSIMARDFIPKSELAQTQSEAISGAYICNNFESFYQVFKNKEIFDKLYTDVFNTYHDHLANNPSNDEYYLSVLATVDDTDTFKINSLYLELQTRGGFEFRSAYILGTYFLGNDRQLSFNPYDRVFEYMTFSPFQTSSPRFFPTFLFLTNMDTTITGTSDVIELYDESGVLLKTYEAGDKYPVLYSSFDLQNNYTTVNLDDYEYVILNLKDYSKKDAFETNLQVKGSVGITPVYNYGQVEKTEVTDRCNLGYSDFTDYRFFILKNDLTNNAFYIVKACEENSSFRFDSTIFDITYVTTENVDDPVVTFGGVDYHTIPFNKLSNSANQNESNNFIPGESGSSLSNIIDNISDFTSDIWNAISSFMGLVTKFFNTLPEEFRYLSITSFTVLTFIAIIKFIRG